jgi:hypothetical protein
MLMRKQIPMQAVLLQMIEFNCNSIAIAACEIAHGREVTMQEKDMLVSMAAEIQEVLSYGKN